MNKTVEAHHRGDDRAGGVGGAGGAGEQVHSESTAILSALTGQAILIIDADDRIQYASDSVAALIDMPGHLLRPGTPRRDFNAFRSNRGDFGEDHERCFAEIMESFAPGREATLESTTPDGRTFWATSIPLGDGGSAIIYTDTTGFYEAIHEIERRKTELEAANKRNGALVSNLRAVVENIDYGVVFMDKDLNATLVNRGFRDIWGMDDEFLKEPRTMRELMEYNRANNIYDVEEEDWEAYVTARQEAVRAGVIAPTEIRRRDGRILSYQCVALPDGRRMMTYYDITDIKRREDESRRHAKALDVIQNAISHGLSWVDQDLIMRAYNKKFFELLEFPEDHFEIGDPLEKFFRYNADRGEYGEGDKDKQVQDRVDLASKFQPHQFERTRGDGTILHIEGFPVPEGGFVTVYTDVTEKRRSEKQIAFLAHHDALTGLPNRLRFNEVLKQAKINAEASPETFAVICFDLDHFKDVNDTLGHAVGDQLLKAVAARMREDITEADTLCRLGGDEFAVIQHRLDSRDQAGQLAQRIVDMISEPFDIDGNEIVVGASAGIAICAPGDCGGDPDQLLRSADLALYSVKGEGRGTHCYFKEEMNLRLRQRKDLESDLRVALEENQFQVHYQPQVDAGDKHVVGVEALLRWEHPTRGLVPPSEFIALSEDTGLIRKIGEYMLRAACEAIAPWRPVKLAVNLSPVQFRKNDIFQMVSTTLAETGFEPERLELEITESVLLLDTDETIAALTRLKDLGISIAMDDFGTGYSSLSYLRRFPFDKLKIDRNFIRDIGHSSDSNAIVQAVIGLGKSLGMRANAEGVETHLQADILRLEGCDELQGYYFGRPMPIAQLEATFRDQNMSPSAQPAGMMNPMRKIARSG